MDADNPKKPWWRRKRTGALAALWLFVSYFAAVGAACYGHARGWLRVEAVNTFAAPAWAVEARVPVVRDVMHGYRTWCARRGYEDAGWIVAVDADGHFELWPRD
jgi:hypothetical protein